MPRGARRLGRRGARSAPRTRASSTRFASSPACSSPARSNFLPLEVGWRNPFLLEGEPPPARPEDAPQAQLHSVSDGYFEAMGAAIASRPRRSPRSTAPTPPGVVVVNETFARRYLPEARAVGHRHRASRASGIGPLGVNLKASACARRTTACPFEVIGVVKDVRNVPLGQAVEPAIYFVHAAVPVLRGVHRGAGDRPRGGAVGDSRRAAQRPRRSVPMAAARTWGERFAARPAEPRLLMSVLLFFGGLAALLAALGVYGLFSWSVALRTRELAIRLDARRPAAGSGRPGAAPERGARGRRPDRPASAWCNWRTPR